MSLSTSYDDQRRRLAFLEFAEAFERNLTPARARCEVAKTLQLSAEQVRNIERGRRKHLYTDVAVRIDQAFLALATRAKRILDHEMAMASTSARGVDPGVVESAKATNDALAALIDEAEGLA